MKYCSGLLLCLASSAGLFVQLATAAYDAGASDNSCLVLGVPTAVGVFAFDEYRCNKALEVLGIYLSGEGWFGKLYGNFYTDGTIVQGFDEVTECSAQSVKVCGVLGSDEFLLGSLREYVGGLGPQILKEILLKPDGTCPDDLVGEIIYLRSEAPSGGGSDPLSISAGLSICEPSLSDFPFGCTCERAQFASPFYLNTEIEVSNKTTTTLYCFDVRVAAYMANSWTSSCGQSTTVSKVEFWVDYSKRRSLRKIWVRESDGSKTSMPATWGAPSDNTLRVTGLSWSMGQVDTLQPKVCLELTHNTPIRSFCLSPDGPSPVCTAAIVDATRKCCPVYHASRY